MSQRRAEPTTRIIRAVVLSSTAAASSTIAHAVAGGHTPTGTSLVVTLALLTGLAVPIAHRAEGFWSAAVMLTGLQGVTHAANVVASWGRITVTPPVRDLGHSGHHGERAAGVSQVHADGLRADLDTRIETGMGSGMDTGLLTLVPSVPMLTAHLGAATLLAWAFTSTERSWQVTRRLLDAAVTRPVTVLLNDLARGLRVLAAVCVTPVEVAHRPIMALPSLHPGRDVWTRPSLVRRGPPHSPLG